MAQNGQKHRQKIASEEKQLLTLLTLFMSAKTRVIRALGSSAKAVNPMAQSVAQAVAQNGSHCGYINEHCMNIEEYART